MIEKRILEILYKPSETGVNILISPELTVDGDMLCGAMNWLDTKNGDHGLKIVAA